MFFIMRSHIGDVVLVTVLGLSNFVINTVELSSENSPTLYTLESSPFMVYEKDTARS